MEEHTTNQVRHPTHYNTGRIEVWDAIMDWNLDFMRGNIIKYVARAGHKGDELEDLNKAKQYLDKIIEIEQSKRADGTAIYEYLYDKCNDVKDGE